MRAQTYRLVLLLAALLPGGCVAPQNGGEAPLPAEARQARDLLAAGDITGARRALESFVGRRPSDPDAYAIALAVAGKLENRDLVEEFASRALTAIPPGNRLDRTRVLLAIGHAYDALKDRDNAIRHYAQAVELSPESPEALNALGYTYAEAGIELDRAVEMIQKAIRIARDQGASDEALGMIVDSLGWAYYKQGRLKDAIETLEEAVELFPGAPGRPEVAYHLGVAYEDANRLAEAQAMLMRAVVMAPEDRVVRRAMERVSSKLRSLETSSPKPGNPPLDRDL